VCCKLVRRRGSMDVVDVEEGKKRMKAGLSLERWKDWEGDLVGRQKKGRYRPQRGRGKVR